MSQQPYTIFISDLHLEPAAIDITVRFLQLMRTQSGRADTIYILGDFFNAFLGEDDHNAYIEQIKAACRDYVQHGGRLFLMPGNRDFLMQQRFAASIGATCLHDPTTIKLYGKTLLLTHGDGLCWDDHGHQHWRRFYRLRGIHALAHIIPLRIRQGLAKKMRRRSTAQKLQKPAHIMDVNATAVLQALTQSKCDYLIHGHTHRPADHGRRLVLGAWPDANAIIQFNADGSYQRLSP